MACAFGWPFLVRSSRGEAGHRAAWKEEKLSSEANGDELSPFTLFSAKGAALQAAQRPTLRLQQ